MKRAAMIFSIDQRLNKFCRYGCSELINHSNARAQITLHTFRL